MDPNNITKTYTNGEVTIVWQSGKCCHTGNCVRHNSQIFRPGEKPWIVAEGASTKDIIETVNKCPSGALTYYMNADKP